ncbi:MAG: tetratricopeptide repeat-containing sulfotransferase family protein [Gammaproteobacteria bacterium]
MTPADHAVPADIVQQLRGADTARRRGDYALAQDLYRGLTRAHPDLAEAWHYYGLFLHERGDNDSARQCLARAERLAPHNFDFLCAYGRVLLQLDDAGTACILLERAHSLRPRDSRCLVWLAQAALTLQQGERMIPELERALGREGDNWRLWLALADCRAQTGNRRGALAAYGEATLFAPETVSLPWLRRGEAALTANTTDTDGSARMAFETALQRDPGSGGARLGLALLAAQAGEFADAERLARDALARDRSLYTAWTLLTSLRRKGDREFDAELARAIAQAPEGPESAALHFAHGSSLEKLGRYDEAFAAYSVGNRLRASKYPYHPDTQAELTRNLIDHLDADFVARADAVGLREARPIFVCGMPRSGTTLVETMLAAHPEVGAGGEMRYIHDRLLSQFGRGGMLELGSWLAGRPDAELHTLATDWRRVLDKARAGSGRVTDKMPGNYATLGFIHVCFPRAAIVHVRRDPRDTCFSCYATMFNESYEFSYALDALGHHYRLYECLMAHWRRVLGAARIIEVEYERLVADPETECRRLLAALDLAWDPACLAFHKTRRKVATASLGQVRRPIYSSSIGRWRHFERHLGPLVEALAMPDPL